MLGATKTNLNVMSYDAVFRMLAVVEERSLSILHVYVDTLGRAEKYEAMLGAKFPKWKFTVRPKADSLFPVVSAASIVAKVTRDRLLVSWTPSERVEMSRIFGSGYPGDPVTVQWLQDHVHPIFGYPRLVRFSWSSTERVLEKEAVAVRWPSDEPANTMHSLGLASMCSLRLG